METPAELAQLAQRSDRVAKLLLPPNEDPAGELLTQVDLWLAKMARIVTCVTAREKMAAWERTCHSLLNAIAAVFARESKAKQVGELAGKHVDLAECNGRLCQLSRGHVCRSAAA